MLINIYVLLVVQISFISAEGRSSVIVQTFPSDNSYCCRFPNVNLKCTFSENPVIAYWTVNGNLVRVRDHTLGHTVDSLNGALILRVSEMQYSMNKTYTCTAEYSDGEVVRSVPYKIPVAEGHEEPIYLDIEPTQNTLNVTWRYEFPECRQFTVLLNGMPVPGCTNITGLKNCTIRNLAAGIQYNITLNAYERSAEPINDSHLVTTLVQRGTGFCSLVTGICIWLSVVVVVLLVLLFALVIPITCWLIHRNKRN